MSIQFSKVIASRIRTNSRPFFVRAIDLAQFGERAAPGMRSSGISHNGKDLQADVVVDSLALLEPYAFDRLLNQRESRELANPPRVSSAVRQLENVLYS
jgi:hypothetical protein